VTFLGIDISKDTFNAHLLSDGGGHKKSFPNSEVGFKQLDAWLRNRGAQQVESCMEATGSYSDALASQL